MRLRRIFGFCRPDRRWKGLARDTQGHALMEGGLVFIPFFALMLAIVDFGMAIFLKNTFQHAAREGVRYAVTYQTTGGMGHDYSIRQVVKTNAMGFLNTAAGDSMIHIRYYNPNTLLETGGNNPGNIVEVSIEGYSFGVMAPLLRAANPIPLNVRASDRMESLPGGTSPPAR